MKVKTKRVCNNCKETAIIWSNDKWWCSKISNPGVMNITGACYKEKK